MSTALVGVSVEAALRAVKRSGAHQHWEAFGDLLESFRPCLLRLAEQQIRGSIARRLDAGDIVQETLLVAYRDFQGFRGNTPAEFGAWLRAILLHRLQSSIARHRSCKRDIRREVALESGQLESSGPQIDLEKREETLALRSVLANLPARYAEIIQLREYQQLPYARIRKRLGVTEQLARVLHFRALRMLRRKLNCHPLFNGQ